ncbi:MAG TPA: hypothetical protein VK427_02215 [Kofleriaceae bacterium]|nr:hypothetical protein [Kofleriaceae bacterium]
MWLKRAGFAGGALVALAITVYAAGGSKRTAEKCTDDTECSRGHCHTKKDGAKACVDCSASEISDLRGQIARYCKDEPRSCDRIPGATEVAEEFFNVRLENADRCVKARDEEMRRCWDGGDSDHKEALRDAEKARKICYDELNSRKGNGGIYTCSDSTYSSRASDVESACAAYGRGCDAWSKDDKLVSCSDIEEQMKKAAKCVEAVEKLDSDCLPRLSQRREAQFRDGKKAYDGCKEVLDYKKDKKLCK